MYTLFNAKRSNGDNTNEVQLDSAIDQAISYDLNTFLIFQNGNGSSWIQ